MIAFPNAKINLGLSVTEKRKDGYHNLETVFYPITLTDALEIQTGRDAREKVTLYQYGFKATDDLEDNLVVKAYRLLDNDFNLPSVSIYLYKRIPFGAGLGGGSSDAAFMLKLLNDQCALGLSEEELEQYASQLGADCAFFIKNKSTFAEGIGNIFSPIDLSLKDYQIIIIKPDIFVSTRDAFSNIRPCRPERSLREVVAKPVGEWRQLLANDFEKSIFPKYPLIEEIKHTLYEKGAIYAAMSGSGSSVFGLFEAGASLPEIVLPDNAFLFKGKLL